MSRREALVGRFRAGAKDKLRRCSLLLIEMEQSHGTAEQVREVARELHTIKGEARMLGFAEISEAVHQAEDLLKAAGEGMTPSPEVCAELLRQFDALGQALWGGPEAPQSPPPATVASPASLQAAPGSGPRWIQINADRVDDLCERIAAFTADFRTLGSLLRHRSPARAVGAGWFRSFGEEYERCISRLEDVSGAAWSLRLVPVEPMLEELLKHARDLSQGQGKRLRVVVKGGAAQLERSVLDSLWEPLLHLVRNAVDHGLEAPAERGDKDQECLLTLSAETVGPGIVLTIADDGRGVDPEKVRATAIARGFLPPQHAGTLSDKQVQDLLFSHGFSTRDAPGALSGRGVGLDVVRETVEGLGGSVALSSQPGRGTQISLTVPSTITRERAVVVDCGGLLYAIPSRQVIEVLLLDDLLKEEVAGGHIVRHRDEAVPLRSLSGSLSGRVAEPESLALIILISGRRFAFSVPALLGEYELLRQPADPLLGRLSYIAASATLDDGRLVLVLAAAALLRKQEDRPIKARPAMLPPRVLVVDDSPIIRDLLCQFLSGAGLEVQAAPEARSALALLHADRPDVVLLDVDMPGMDGFELLECIRGETQDLPVIMFTTRFSPDDRIRAATLGANAYLVKSQFQESTLIETVRRFAPQRPRPSA
jgi:chemotaxis protein histidine kinase CheA